MKKETLKDWCKEWSIDDIVSNVVSQGMCYLAEKMTTEELHEYKKVIIKEIKRRIKSSPQE